MFAVESARSSPIYTMHQLSHKLIPHSLIPMLIPPNKHSTTKTDLNTLSLFLLINCWTVCVIHMSAYVQGSFTWYIECHAGYMLLGTYIVAHLICFWDVLPLPEYLGNLQLSRDKDLRFLVFVSTLACTVTDSNYIDLGCHLGIFYCCCSQ